MEVITKEQGKYVLDAIIDRAFEISWKGSSRRDRFRSSRRILNAADYYWGGTDIDDTTDEYYGEVLNHYKRYVICVTEKQIKVVIHSNQVRDYISAGKELIIDDEDGAKSLFRKISYFQEGLEKLRENREWTDLDLLSFLKTVKSM